MNRRRASRRVIRFVNFAVAVLLIVLAAYFAVRAFSPSGSQRAVVPGLRGVPIAEALAQLEASGFRGRAADHVRDSSVAAGLVVSQVPAAGSRVRNGTLVQLRVSAGASRVVVPDLTGLTLQDARARLGALSLRVGRLYTAPAGRAGTVHTQHPAMGTIVASDARVNLTITEESP